jgi:thioredoxin reductase
MTHADVVIVGAGPSGLSAAIELRRRGIERVIVVEREPQAGGIPRHTNHLGFGLRDLHRVMSGPHYAAALADRAAAAGVELMLSSTVTGLKNRVFAISRPTGSTSITADAVVLATGVRERPRSARLIPGDRPAGVFTTGALQQFALRGDRIGNRAVILGAEHVSFSALLTLRHVGCSTAAMITPRSRHQSSRALRLVTATAQRVPIRCGVDIAEIRGRRRVEAVVLSDGSIIECDTVITSGAWVPDNELVRLAGLGVDARSKAPVVDRLSRTTQPGVFATGNLTHPAETADVCALDGRQTAETVASWLTTSEWPTTLRPIEIGPGIAWAAHCALGVTARVEREFRGAVQLSRSGDVLARVHRNRWMPETAVHLRAELSVLRDAPVRIEAVM